MKFFKYSASIAIIIFSLSAAVITTAGESEDSDTSDSVGEEVPKTMTYVGELREDGKPLDGEVEMKFALYESPREGESVWSVTKPDVEVKNGKFSAQLGEETPIKPVFDGRKLWLELVVNGTTLEPRARTGFSPYAVHSEKAHVAQRAKKVGSKTPSDLRAYENEESGLDATTLQAAITELNAKIEGLKETNSQLQQKVSDLESKLKNRYTKEKADKTFARQDNVYSKTKADETFATQKEVENTYAKGDNLSDLKDKTDTIQEKTEVISRKTVDGNDSLVVENVNLHLRNGDNSTSSTNGTGNLIVGYTQSSGNSDAGRTGSHNIVVGSGHEYTSHGSIVSGKDNTVTSPGAIVGGQQNTVEAPYSAITGGANQTAATEGVHLPASTLSDVLSRGADAGGRSIQNLGTVHAASYLYTPSN